MALPGGQLRELRRQQAAERQAERVKRSAAQQVKELDQRLGVGTGAVQERKRLAAVPA